MTSIQEADERAASRICQNPRSRWVLAAVAALLISGAATAASPAASAPADSAAFLKVGDTVITHQEYDVAFAQATRAKFYHGKPPDDQIAVLQREVGQSLVDEVLLVREAQRRKLQPDQAAIKQTLAGYEERYRGSEQWKNSRERLLPQLQRRLERENLLEQLSRQVRQVREPTEPQLQQYWETHKEKFTEPEQLHLSMILLKVPPSSSQAQWDGARGEGAAIVKRLRAGADFRQLAQLHSGDTSAERGGDLGYVHQGMLPELAQKPVDQLKPGEISDAVVLLEGVAVFRLEERKPARLNGLNIVGRRARDLWMRDKADEQWTALVARLRRETPVQVDDSRYLPLASANKAGDHGAPR